MYTNKCKPFTVLIRWSSCFHYKKEKTKVIAPAPHVRTQLSIANLTMQPVHYQNKIHSAKHMEKTHLRLDYDYFYLSHTQLYREYITSSEMYSLHLTHPKWTHTRSSGQPCYSARGAVGGSVPCSTSVVVLKEDTPPTNNPCRTWDSNPQPSAYKSDSLSIRPRLPP